MKSLWGVFCKWNCVDTHGAAKYAITHLRGCVVQVAGQWIDQQRRGGGGGVDSFHGKSTLTGILCSTLTGVSLHTVCCRWLSRIALHSPECERGQVVQRQSEELCNFSLRVPGSTLTEGHTKRKLGCSLCADPPNLVGIEFRFSSKLNQDLLFSYGSSQSSRKSW